MNDLLAELQRAFGTTETAERLVAWLPDVAAAIVILLLFYYNVAMELRVWLADEKQHIPARLALRERLFEALRTGGIDMPYETLALAPVDLRGTGSLSPGTGHPGLGRS